jgi:hypothetical protein
MKSFATQKDLQKSSILIGSLENLLFTPLVWLAHYELLASLTGCFATLLLISSSPNTLPIKLP